MYQVERLRNASDEGCSASCATVILAWSRAVRNRKHDNDKNRVQKQDHECRDSIHKTKLHHFLSHYGIVRVRSIATNVLTHPKTEPRAVLIAAFGRAFAAIAISTLISFAAGRLFWRINEILARIVTHQRFNFCRVVSCIRILINPIAI